MKGPLPALNSALEQHKRWRFDTARMLSELRQWLEEARLADPPTPARLAHLEQRVGNVRVKCCVVGTADALKTFLVEGTLFSDLGVSPLPDALRKSWPFPVEFRYAAAAQCELALLPVTTHTLPVALRALLQETEHWERQPLDLSSAAAVKESFARLADTIDLQQIDATAWGISRIGVARSADDTLTVPRWRYARISMPHPLLRGGLNLLVMPSARNMQHEAELALHVLPDTDIAIFAARADAPPAAEDLTLWTRHLVATRGNSVGLFGAIDISGEDSRGEDADNGAVSLLARRLSLSVAQCATLTPVPLAMADPVLTTLAHRLAEYVITEPAESAKAGVQAEVLPLLSSGKQVLDSRFEMINSQVRDLQALNEKNTKLLDQAMASTADGSERFRNGSADFNALVEKHGVITAEVRALLNREDIEARTDALCGVIAHGSDGTDIWGSIDRYFNENTRILREAFDRLDAIQAMLAEANRTFTVGYRLRPAQIPSFTTERFWGEMNRLRADAAERFGAAKASMLRTRRAIADEFREHIGDKVDHAFHVAGREANVWMNALPRPFEQQLHQLQSEVNARLEKLTRMRTAHDDLASRLDALTRARDDLARQRESLADRAVKLKRQLERRAE